MPPDSTEHALVIESAGLLVTPPKSSQRRPSTSQQRDPMNAVDWLRRQPQTSSSMSGTRTTFFLGFFWISRHELLSRGCTIPSPRRGTSSCPGFRTLGWPRRPASGLPRQTMRPRPRSRCGQRTYRRMWTGSGPYRGHLGELDLHFQCIKR